MSWLSKTLKKVEKSVRKTFDPLSGVATPASPTWGYTAPETYSPAKMEFTAAPTWQGVPAYQAAKKQTINYQAPKWAGEDLYAREAQDLREDWGKAAKSAMQTATNRGLGATTGVIGSMMAGFQRQQAKAVGDLTARRAAAKGEYEQGVWAQQNAWRLSENQQAQAEALAVAGMKQQEALSRQTYDLNSWQTWNDFNLRNRAMEQQASLEQLGWEQQAKLAEQQFGYNVWQGNVNDMYQRAQSKQRGLSNAIQLGTALASVATGIPFSSMAGGGSSGGDPFAAAGSSYSSNALSAPTYSPYSGGYYNNSGYRTPQAFIGMS